MVTKRKRRKSRRAKRGVYTSLKTGQVCKFRSSWEERYCQYLDSAVHVKDWKYEPFPISYISNQKTGKTRKYYPDFIVETMNGDKEVIEIKPSTRVNKPNIMKKTLAARFWCSQNGMIFTIVTEKELKILQLM